MRSSTAIPVLSTPSYIRQILNMFDSAIVSYIPCDDLSGTTLRDLSPTHARTAALAGATPPTLGAPGISNGRTAVRIHAATSSLNWFTTALQTAFTTAVGRSGSVMLWFKISDVSVWTDGVARNFISLDAANDITIQKLSTGATIRCIHNVGGSNRIINFACKTPGWFHLAFTWSQSLGVRLYGNGVLLGNTSNCGAYSGTLVSTTTQIGMGTTGSPLSGDVAHVLLLNRPATAAEILRTYSLGMKSVRLAVIGDDISAISSPAYGWVYTVRDQFNGGIVSIFPHTTAGASIIATLDSLALASVNDNADKIIIALGTNDDNAGDMTALQAEVEENIAELRVSNYSATVYYMNVLPRWTDVGGGTPVDKSNIRTAIAAACTSQGIACWDTFTAPWITAADTTDGLIPNAAGIVKINTEVLARL